MREKARRQSPKVRRGNPNSGRASHLRPATPFQRGGRGSTLWAVILAAFALSFLAGGVFLTQVWRAAAESARQYHAALNCGQRESADCWREEWVSVADISSTGGKNPRKVFTVGLRDGSATELVDEDRSGLEGEMTPGAEALAVFWKGKVVSLRGASGKTMVTQHDPDWQAKDNLLASVLSLIAAVIFGYLAFVAARGRPYPTRG